MNGAVLDANRGAVLLAIVTYVTVFGAALVTRSDIEGLNAGVEGVSSSAGTALGGLANVLPLGYAFGAGMVAAVNPVRLSTPSSANALPIDSDKLQPIAIRGRTGDSRPASDPAPVAAQCPRNTGWSLG